jgi:phosphoglycerol transferase MdoB-like AlkP superfamily enzyme
MIKTLRSIPKHLRYIFTIYFWGLVFFGGYRLVLLLVNLKLLSGVPAGVVAKALGMGLRFDTVVSGFLLALPLLVLSVTAGFRRESKLVYIIISAFLWLAYSISFFGCAADIPYFAHYYSRLTVAVLQWTDTPGFMAKMVLQDRNYYPFILLVLISWLLWWLVIKRAGKILAETEEGQTGLAFHILKISGLSLLAAFLVFLGIRGRIEHKSPIRIGTAFFSTYPFPNQLGLNPLYTFFRSAMDASKAKGKRVNLMSDAEALEKAGKYLKGTRNSGFDSPLARRMNQGREAKGCNVILVIMEGLSAERMVRYGAKDSLTPFLDSIAGQGLCFDNIYTSGFHTFNGVYGTLFGMPALFKQHPMHGAISLQPFDGIGRTLLDNGYTTAYFCTHDAQFDNMSGFLGNNGYMHIISQADYPSDKVLSTLGVPDDYMFQYAMPLINKWHQEGRPFYAAFLTSSNHGPVVIPPWVKKQFNGSTPEQQIIQYSDWALSEFVRECSKETWFSNTIFAFVADHGGTIDPIYDLPLSLNHTPLIIYAPGIIKRPQVVKYPGCQIDAGPTILGLLDIPYVNNTLGVDLLKEPRPFAYFCADDKVGVINDKYYLILRENGPASLYEYRKKDINDRLAQHRALADSMRDYAYSMMQAAQWMIENKKTGPQK